MVFPPSKNVRIVSVESEYPLTMREKKVLYPKIKHIHGFKTDIRLVVGINTEEVDLAIFECAKGNSGSNSTKDEDKLLREAEDALDGIIQNTHVYDFHLMTYFIEITGTHCSFSQLWSLLKVAFMSPSTDTVLTFHPLYPISPNSHLLSATY